MIDRNIGVDNMNQKLRGQLEKLNIEDLREIRGTGI